MQARALSRTACTRGDAFLILLLVFFATERARADEHVPFVLEYTAPPTCPREDRFLDEVAARTSLARPAQPNEHATTLTVVIKDVAGGNKGTLKLESVDGATSARQVSAADCEQVVAALALMTALAIDPNASTASVPSVGTPQPKAVEPAAGTAKDEDARLRAAPSLRKPTRGPWRFQIGTALEALAGVAPEPLLLVRPFVEIGSTGASAWNSALRFSAGFGRNVAKEREAGAEFTLLAGRIEGCPAQFRVTRTFQLSPCLAVDAGRLQVVGLGVTPAERVAAPWIAPGVLGRLQWEIVGTLVVEVSGEVFFPFARDRFFVNADATLYRTPAVAEGAAAALGGRFP